MASVATANAIGIAKSAVSGTLSARSAAIAPPMSATPSTVTT